MGRAAPWAQGESVGDAPGYVPGGEIRAATTLTKRSMGSR
jgi:hypothetical protein